VNQTAGAVPAPMQYLLPDLPPENIMALREVVLKAGKYPL
jgi:hypothetical protein